MNVSSEVKEYNKKLCERFPFLIPTNAWSEKKITDGAGFWPGSPDSIPEYDYERTKLDCMPDGWRKAFGEQMCEEIREALIKDDLLYKYLVIDIKEKYGALRWYDRYGNDEAHEIIKKYFIMSEHTCIDCGETATKRTTDWISPYCNKCATRFSESVLEDIKGE